MCSTHTQCIAVHCDKECNTQGSHCRSATGATASFTLHCLFSLQSIVTNSNTLQSSALQSITVQFSALQFQLSFQFEVQCSGKRCGGASCCVTEGSSKQCQAKKPRVPTRWTNLHRVKKLCEEISQKFDNPNNLQIKSNAFQTELTVVWQLKGQRRGCGFASAQILQLSPISTLF